MEWLSPLTAVWATAAAVPLLTLLYFLKLKRREHLISSTLLWKRAVQDLQVNAPFQKIRRNILLLLQLLAMAAILLALGGPIVRMMNTGAKRYVILIDRSASMNASDVQPSRLEEAKRQAKVFVESLPRRSLLSLNEQDVRVMAIAFDQAAKVICNFTSDRKQVIRAIESISPADGTSSISQALTAARAFAQPVEGNNNNRSAEEPAKLMLFSDGRIADLDKQAVGSEEVVYHKIGRSGDNLAIIAMQARREFEDPQQVNVFLTLANYGDKQAATDVELSVNDTVVSVRTVQIEPLRISPDGKTKQPGRLSMDFSFRNEESSVIRAGLVREDTLLSDNAGFAIVSAKKNLAVLLVTEGNSVLRSALKACGPEKLDVATAAEFEAQSEALSVQQTYDVIVLDNIPSAKRPRGRYLVFGTPPAEINVSVAGQSENQLIADWRTRHPVLQYVNLNTLFAAKSLNLQLPRDAEVLAEFSKGPAIAVLRRQGSVFLLAGFDVLSTNWPFEPGFVLFCYNSLQYLSAQETGQSDGILQAGQPFVVEGLPAGAEATVSGPGISGLKITATGAGTIRLPSVETVGLYRMDITGQTSKFFAVNLTDEQESRIEPVESLQFAGGEVRAETKPVGRANLALWPYLTLAALLVCLLEWRVYTGKMKI